MSIQTTIKIGDRVLDAHPWTLYGEGTVTEVIGDDDGDGGGVNVRFDNYRSYRSQGDYHYRGPKHFTLIPPTVEPLADLEWALFHGKWNEPIFRALVDSYLAKVEDCRTIYRLVQETA